MSDHMRSVMDDLVSPPVCRPERPLTQWCAKGLSDHVVGNSSMFTGEEEVFAFARACSRLVEMGSKQWAETAGYS